MHITFIKEPNQTPYTIFIEGIGDLSQISPLLSDEDRYHIITLYHQANNKRLYKNAEITVNDTTYGVRLEG